MKKTTLLLAAAWMLLLWFVPESAWADPEPKTVSIYQSGFKRGTMLLYPLTPTTVDGITYTPVDLGNGIAWADRNIGANEPEDVGTYFYWGDTEGHASFSNTQYYTGATSIAANQYLPDDKDAARVMLGNNWRMPTLPEVEVLCNTYVPEHNSSSFYSDQDYGMEVSYEEGVGATVKYKYDPNRKVLFPEGKYYKPDESSDTQIYFWTKQRNGSNANGANTGALYGRYAKTYNSMGWDGRYIYHGLPVRPVYVPTCETCTLTIKYATSGYYCNFYNNDGSCLNQEYGNIDFIFRFICEKGQQVTVNPVGNTGYVFYRWLASNNSTPVSVPGNVFTVTENATYYATFQEQGYDITWENYDHSVLDVVYTREGDIPEYTGATPTRPAPDGVDWVYIWTGWTPTPVASTTEATYTATYAQGYTITANTGGSGTVTLTATGYSDKINTGSYVSGTSVTMTANAGTGTTFVRWTDTGSTNPTRVVTVNANAEYTAEFTIESADKLVNIYQSTTADTTKILYLLKSTTVGGITYRPVDMGYGVAWANKNIGASDSTMVGTYFYWGDIEGHSSFNRNNRISTNGMANNYELTPQQDAAYQLMGENRWRIPTDDDFVDLKNKTTIDGNRFISNSDANINILLPQTGAYKPGNYNTATTTTNNSYHYYWSRVLYVSGNSKYPYILLNRNNGEGFEVNISDYTNYNNIYYGMPIRAIYNPGYDTYKLTVKVGSNKYVYVCQPGQNVTVTAIANTAANQVFKWWKDNQNTDATRVFTMTADLEVEAVFQFNSSIPHGTATFKDWDNTQLAQVEVAAGSEPVYSGATPTRVGYTFTGWSPAITAMTDGGNVIYTATYSRESADAFVDVYQNVSSNSTKILYYLPVEKEFNDGNKYSAIDMGYGVAWADRNVGANSSTDAGDYFYWAGTETRSCADTYYSGVTSLSDGTIMDSSVDAATVNMGDAWRIPTTDEWQALIDNTTVSGNQFINKGNSDYNIQLPYGGGVFYNSNCQVQNKNAYGFYWSSRLYQNRNNYGDYSYSRADILTNQNATSYSVSWTNIDALLSVRAIYKPSYTTYTLTINVGSYSYQYICQAGQSITVTANANEGYEFDEWKLENGTTTDATDTHLATRTFTITGNITRTATFKEAPTGKTIVWQDEDGTELERDENVTLGTMPSYDSETPAKDATAQYTYSFSGWSPTVVAVTDDATYTATYNSKLRSYTITFENEDGTELQSGSVSYGETPSYDGETPTKDEDAENTYTFDAWSPAIAEVTGNTTYTATFTATPKPAELHIVLEEAEDDDYYDDFANHQGKTANTVTLNRQFEQGRWSTLCLPFEVSGGMMTTLKMSGRVYEFKYATGNANVGSGVNLYFSNAKKMEAGKGYIVNANATLAEKTSFVFSNVKIDVTADSVKPLNSATAYNKLPGYKSEGTIELVGTLRNGTLKGTESGNTYMGLKSNKIYYPNISQGSTIWAYRGIFRSSKALDIKNMQKMRIIVDGEDMGELFIDEDGEILDASGNAESRKFIRDGVLYIEREGVVYDAQGKRVESSF